MLMSLLRLMGKANPSIVSSRLYVARGTLWKQKVLLYDNGIRLSQLFKKEYQPQHGDEASLIGLFNYLHESGIMKKAFNIILRPAFGFGLWNRLLMAIQGVAGDELIRLFDEQQIVGVSNDFFVINSRWISGYTIFANASVLNQEMIPIVPGIASLKNPLFPLQMEGLKSRGGF